MKKKVFIFALCALMLCCTLAIFTACDDDKENEVDNSDVKFVLLGDSIAEAVLGPSPISEREYYSYCGILGQINGYTYHNRSISGYTTGQMLEYISREADDSAYTHITHIKQADIIGISILGNDFLQNKFNEKLLAAVNDDYIEADAILVQSYINVEKIIAKLKELNPTAKILFQTVYNPVYPESTIINQSTRNVLFNTYNFTKEDMYLLGAKLINRLNDVIFTYVRNHPGDIMVLDVNAKFDALYQADTARLDRLIYADCVHPSNEGHAVIASLYQEKLEDLGLADHDSAIANYKTLRCEQIDRLYSGTTVDVKKAKKAIKAATTYNKVNEAYFDATLGVVPNY